MSIRCALYPRVSTEEQFVAGRSIPAQKKELREYAQKMGYQIVGIYTDEGISARKPVSKRPALLRLLRDVEQDKIDIILVTKLDRWFRNIKEYQLTQEILDAHNCYWKTIHEDYDTSTANGQLIVNIMLAVAQNEADRTSERIRTVFAYKESIGEVKTGMCAPYGYRIVNNRIQKDESVSHIVEDAFDYYFKCYSVREVYRYLSGKYGENAPSFNKTDRLFKNEKYCGRWRENDHYCEAYITPDQFDRILSVKNARTFGLSGDPYIFSGLIQCPLCPRHYTGTRSRRTCKDGSQTERKLYRCMPKYGYHRGGTPILTEKYIEQYMLEHVVEQLQEDILRAEKRLKKARSSPAPAAVQAEIDRLNSMYQKGRISDEYYDSQYAELSAKLEKYQSGAIDLESYAPLLKTFQGNWREVYEQLDCAHRCAFWKSVIKDITLSMETRKISGFHFLL